MVEEPNVTASIKAKGWRQLSVLPSLLVEKLRDQSQLPDFTKDCELWIVLSHDCDVTNASLESEPFVVIVPAHTINPSLKDGNKEWGKNPRLFQFEGKDNNQVVRYQLCIHDITRIPREKLSEYAPDDLSSVHPDVRQSIIYWVSKRYIRASFPDAFNNRTKKAANTLRNKFKKDGHLISGIYIHVQDTELEDDEEYQIIVWVTMKDDYFDNLQYRTVAQMLVNQLEAEFGTSNGINVDVVELRAEREVSLSDLIKLKRWDFDDLSLRQSEFPPTS